MATVKPAPAALVQLKAGTIIAADLMIEKDLDVRFGKTDKVVKLAFPIGAEMPTGVLYVGKDGQTFLQDFSRYPDSVKGILLFHGSKQKGGDEYADLDTVDDCLEAVRSIDARLADGKWTSDREGFAGISVLMRAIMKVYGIPEADAREFLKPLTAKDKQALRASPELKPTIDAMEAEKGKGVDTSAVLAKLKKPNGDPAGAPAA